MFASPILAAVAALLVTCADARFAAQGSSNVAVYWGEIGLAILSQSFVANGVG